MILQVAMGTLLFMAPEMLQTAPKAKSTKAGGAAAGKQRRRASLPFEVNENALLFFSSLFFSCLRCVFTATTSHTLLLLLHEAGHDG